MTSPVIANKEGINLQPEKMEIEKLYHCIYENKVFLFYKDDEELLHCYEVEDEEAVYEIKHHPENFEDILKQKALL